MAQQQYDCAIIGGGVAGLALAISLSRAGKWVVLFEKKVYPFHKVCGEYLSTECTGYLERLGVPLSGMDLPQIHSLLLTSPSGIAFRRALDIGGTGLSRYVLDDKLYQLAVDAGATVHTGTAVREWRQHAAGFEISFSGSRVQTKTLVGAYGKHSLKETSLQDSVNDREYIAVKHHLRTDYDPSVVEMHNFPGGYCGMSAIEEGKVNLSYICRKILLQQHKTLDSLQKEVLSTNPYLREYFRKALFLFEKPLTISRLHFQIRTPVSDGMLLLGDAAGNIAPLSGNGMSMALLSAVLAQEQIIRYLDKEISFDAYLKNYAERYYQSFSGRIGTARLIHRFFGKKYLTDVQVAFLRVFPMLYDRMSPKIHGEPF